MPAGTFLQADRSFIVNLEEGPLLLADGVRDYHLSGRDALTGRMVTNRGNYGMLYRVQLRAPEDKAMGVILTSLAGGFAGAFTFNGVAYTAPRTGILRTRDQGVLLGTLAAGETGELLLMPPRLPGCRCGSCSWKSRRVSGKPWRPAKAGWPGGMAGQASAIL